MTGKNYAMGIFISTAVVIEGKSRMNHMDRTFQNDRVRWSTCAVQRFVVPTGGSPVPEKVVPSGSYPNGHTGSE